jgi:hypothetical protein
VPTMLGAVTGRPPLRKLTTAELIARSADYAAKAKTARTASARGALDRLAARYAVLAAQREIEETQATRH